MITSILITKLNVATLLISTVFFFIMFCYVSESSEDKSIQLPKPFHKSTISVEEALSLRRSVRSYTDKPVTLEEVSQLLWAAQGINDERGLRTAPSGGALYPLETYVVAGNVTGLSSGLYRYIPQDHRLIEVKKGDIREGLSAASLGQNCVRSAPVSFVFSSVWQRITKKYGERGKRYAIIEVGHAAQNIYLQAVSLNLGTVVVGAFSDDDVKKLIGMENGEDPLYVMPVGRKQ